MSDLIPGSVRRTTVTISNPYPFAITVRRIEARVAGSSRWRCRPTGTNLRIGPYLGRLPLWVPARGRATAGEFEVRMPDTVADACQRTTFRLAFTARAVETKPHKTTTASAVRVKPRTAHDADTTRGAGVER
ncbi:hypothetical protein [Actinoplanes couchii]|nr:hypothetical protein [Actinoplanes couchii]MDR6325232.1 hypothetical protein [Actinoplanes couchii]